MSGVSRRDLLRSASAATVGLLLSPSSVFPSPANDEVAPFELLVVGDSLIWGQGLEEKDKFYSLTKDWLETEAFGRPRRVNLKVKAHSGSTLKFQPNDAEAHKKAGRLETHPYEPEVNVGFPSTWKQIEVAADEYASAGNGMADMVMLTGGITDITVAKVLDPFGKDEWLYGEIRKYCRDQMFDVLEHTSQKFPNALIAVVGYFPMIGPKTRGSRLFNAWLESMNYPRFSKPFVNNVITRRFMSGIRKKGIVRSRIWVAESNRNLQEAVDLLNEKVGRRQAVFVPSPFTEDHSLETKETLLFRMAKKGRVEDPLYDMRRSQCRESLPELKAATGIDYPVRLCEIAAIGHPNAAGARAYAEAIRSALDPIFRRENTITTAR